MLELYKGQVLLTQVLMYPDNLCHFSAQTNWNASRLECVQMGCV